MLKYFRFSEFDSKDENGNQIRGSGRKFMQDSFLLMLEDAREKAKRPFVITSGYRTPARNAQVGGAKNSAHTRGFAADIRTATQEEFEVVASACFRAGFRRFGVMANALHVDNDPNLSNNQVWGYGESTDPKRIEFVRGMFAAFNIIV
jgi:hypothetical protein